jgi:hypothetical protein
MCIWRLPAGVVARCCRRHDERHAERLQIVSQHDDRYADESIEWPCILPDLWQIVSALSLRCFRWCSDARFPFAVGIIPTSAGTSRNRRLYQTGQFLSLRAFASDWRDQSGFFPAGANWQRGDTLSIEEALFTLAEIFEFAARLSNADAGDELMHVKIVFGGLRGRGLVVGDPRRMDFIERPLAQMPEFPQAFDIPRDALLADSRRYAINAAQELFRRFGEELRLDMLRDWLAELVRV